MDILLLFVGLGVVNFLMRLSFIGLLGKRPIPAALQKALRFVPLAILTAITVPEVLLRDGRLVASPLDAKVIAAAVAVGVAAKTRNVPLTIVAGMATLWLVRWALG